MRKIIEDMGRSAPSLHYDFGELDGWMDRLCKQYGYNTLRRIIAAGVNMNPSNTLEPSYRAWAASVPIMKDIPAIPFFALKYLAHQFMKIEGTGPASQAKKPAPSSGTNTTTDILSPYPFRSE